MLRIVKSIIDVFNRTKLSVFSGEFVSETTLFRNVQEMILKAKNNGMLLYIWKRSGFER